MSNGGVALSGIAGGTLTTTITNPSTSASVTTLSTQNSLFVGKVPNGATVTVSGASAGGVPCNPVENSDGTYTWVAALPVPDTYTVSVTISASSWSLPVYVSSFPETPVVTLANVGSLATTITNPNTSATVITQQGVNSLVIGNVPASAFVGVSGATAGSVPCSPVQNGTGSYTWVADLPAADTYTVSVSGLPPHYSIPVYTASSVDTVVANIGSPLTQSGSYPVSGLLPTQPYTVGAAIALASGTTATFSPPANCPEVIVTLSTSGIYLTGVTGSGSQPLPFRMLSQGIYLISCPRNGTISLTYSGTTSGYAYPLNAPWQFEPKLPTQQITGSWSSPYYEWAVYFPHKVKAMAFNLAVGSGGNTDILLGLGAGVGFGPPGITSGTSGGFFAVSNSYNVAAAPNVQTQSLFSAGRALVNLAGTDITWPAATSHAVYCTGGTVSNGYLLVDPA